MQPRNLEQRVTMLEEQMQALRDALNRSLEHVELTRRVVRHDANGELWTGQSDPARHVTLVAVYRTLCESGDQGQQLVAVHQEVIAQLQMLIEAQTSER